MNVLKKKPNPEQLEGEQKIVKTDALMDGIVPCARQQMYQSRNVKTKQLIFPI